MEVPSIGKTKLRIPLRIRSRTVGRFGKVGVVKCNNSDTGRGG